MKKPFNLRGVTQYTFKLTLKMKLTVFLTMVSLLQIQANSYSQSKKITLDMGNVTVTEVLNEIESVSEFKFLFNRKDVDLDRHVSIKVTKKPITNILNELFSGTDVGFEVLNKQIILNKSINKTVPKNIIGSTDINLKPQQFSISGTVTDENGQPLPGANIVEKGTTNGVTADFDGNFSLNVDNGNAILVVSYIGFATKEVTANGQSSISIRMSEDTSGLDEVVVIGYGSVKKNDLTGSVSSVDGSEISLQAVGNPVQGLSGVSSGVQVLRDSGQPGSGLNVLIRGGNSLLGGNNPLYVVDGFPMIGDISSINPNDILSIEILKDASSTAIYGSRGANGVVIVSTKKGKEGTSIEYDGYYGLQSVYKTIDMLNARELGLLANERASNDNMSPYFTSSEISAFGEGTDWQDEIFRTAVIQNHTISISGGNKNTLFNISGSYFDQEGVILNSGYKYVQLRSNIEHNINDNWKIVLNGIVNNNKNNNLLSDNTERGIGVLAGALVAAPSVSPRDSDGNYSNVRAYSFTPPISENPVAMALERKQTTSTHSLLLNFYTEGKFNKNLSFYSSIGVDYENLRDDFYSPSIFQQSALGSATIAYNEYTNLVNENTLTYTAQLVEGHELSVMAGVTSQKTTSQFLRSGSTGFLNDILENNSLQSGSTPNIPTSGISEYTILSGLSRLNYNIYDKYLVTASIRADGSSRFGDSNKWGYFPSAAIAWRISQEEFLKDNEAISSLKLRASWGLTGNTAINPYQSLSILSSEQVVFDNNINIAYAPSGSKPNPDLKWETTAQTDIGLDFGLFNNRLQFNMDYYYKDTQDLIASVPTILSSGYSTQITNLGNMNNKGFEIGMDSRIIDGELIWDMGANFSMNKNKVESLPGGSDIFGVGLGNALPAMSLVREGEPVGVFYGYIEDGLTAEGQINYLDLDGNGEINSLDRDIIGDPNPDFIFGFNTALSYRNFRIDILVNGVQGNDILNYNLSNVANGMYFGENQITDILGNYWTPENPNPNAKYPIISSNTLYLGSNRFIEDGSYVQIKNVKLSYIFNDNSLKSSFLYNSQIYLNIQNLYTFTNYSFYSPIINTRGGGISKGIDQFGYPDSRIIMLGVKINLY